MLTKLSSSFTPHGVDYETWKAATEMEQTGAQWISEGSIAFMYALSRALFPTSTDVGDRRFESSKQFTLTDWAMNHKNKHEHEVKMWDPLKSHFIERLDEVNEAMRKHGLEPVIKGNASAGQKTAEQQQQQRPSVNGGVNGH